MWIFPPLFFRESLKIFPHGNFPHISLKMSMCHNRTYKRFQLGKKSKWCFNANSLVNWNIYRYGKFPSHFNLQFWEKFRGCFSMEISKWFLCSLQQMIHVDKTTCLSSSEFHRGYQESARVLDFWYIFSQSWIYGGFYPGFPPFLGIPSGCLPQISPSPSPCKYDWLMTLRSVKKFYQEESEVV